MAFGGYRANFHIEIFHKTSKGKGKYFRHWGGYPDSRLYRFFSGWMMNLNTKLLSERIDTSLINKLIKCEEAMDNLTGYDYEKVRQAMEADGLDAAYKRLKGLPTTQSGKTKRYNEDIKAILNTKENVVYDKIFNSHMYTSFADTNKWKCWLKIVLGKDTSKATNKYWFEETVFTHDRKKKVFTRTKTGLNRKTALRLARTVRQYQSHQDIHNDWQRNQFGTQLVSQLINLGGTIEYHTESLLNKTYNQEENNHNIYKVLQKDDKYLFTGTGRLNFSTLIDKKTALPIVASLAIALPAGEIKAQRAIRACLLDVQLHIVETKPAYTTWEDKKVPAKVLVADIGRVDTRTWSITINNEVHDLAEHHVETALGSLENVVTSLRKIKEEHNLLKIRIDVIDILKMQMKDWKDKVSIVGRDVMVKDCPADGKTYTIDLLNATLNQGSEYRCIYGRGGMSTIKVPKSLQSTIGKKIRADGNLGEILGKINMLFHPEVLREAYARQIMGWGRLK